MVLAQKISAGPKNIVDDHLDLFNTILELTLKEIASFLKNRDIEFGHLPDFLINPQRYPGNKITGLRQISEKFLQDIISKYYFKIQTQGLSVKFVYRSLIKALFQKGLEFNKTSHITMAIGGSKSPSPLLECNRRVSPRLLIKKNKDQNITSRSKSKPKSRSKSKSKIKKQKKQVKPFEKGRKGSCAYCNAMAKFRATSTTTHINITQKPSHYYFCSNECKNAWISDLLQQKYSQEGQL